MSEKPSITVLYDAAEDVEKAKAEDEGTLVNCAEVRVSDVFMQQLRQSPFRHKRRGRR